VTGGIRLENRNNSPNTHFWWDGNHEMKMVFVMIYFKNIYLRIIFVEFFETLFHVFENTIIENVASVFGNKNKVIVTAVNAVALLAVAHDKRLP
jgi:hypothetical protein